MPLLSFLETLTLEPSSGIGPDDYPTPIGNYGHHELLDGPFLGQT